MKKCNCKIQKVLEDTILLLSDCDDIDEATIWFEEIRHLKSLPKSPELFDELCKSQVAILFKILIDAKQLKLANNKIETLTPLSQKRKKK